MFHILNRHLSLKIIENKNTKLNSNYEINRIPQKGHLIQYFTYSIQTSTYFINERTFFVGEKA